MHPPTSDPDRAVAPARRKRSSRPRAYAVASAPRPSRRAVKFRCRNCGQKVLVDRALRRTAITCPTCQQLVVAPRPGRLWLELCGGTILFLAGLAIGHAPGGKAPLPTGIPTIQRVPQPGQAAAPKTREPKPAWFSDQSDGTP